MSLQLHYAFTPTPNPIRASPPGANANHVDLQVLVTAPASGAVALKKVVIEIPIGYAGAAYLSSDADLPKPRYDTTIPWSIKPDGGRVTVAPIGSAELDGTIVFTLPQIAVESTPEGGVVAVTITEHYSDGTAATDASSYELLKQPASFVVTKFVAAPPVLDDVDLPVTLRWQVDDAGKLLRYRIDPADPANPGPFDAAAGATGVPSAPLDADTTFTLEVIESGLVTGSVPLTVRVEVPRVIENSYTKSFGRSGRVVAMHWGARHAARCEVAIEGRPVDKAAPVSTYHRPYYLLVAGPTATGGLELGVTAYSATTSASDTWQHTVHVGDPVPVGGSPNLTGGYAVVTPDSRVALVPIASGDQAGVVVVDLTAPETPPALIATGGLGPRGVSIVGDGSTAIVWGDGPWSDDFSGFVTQFARIDVAARTVGPAISVQGDQSVGDLAATPDGTVALAVNNEEPPRLLLLDLGSGATRPLPVEPCGWRPSLAVTPDGSLGLAGTRGGDLAVIGLPSGVVEPAPILMGAAATATVQLSQDGTLALVYDSTNGRVIVVDVAGRAVSGSAIAIGGNRMAFPPALSPDGRAALAPLYHPKAVGLIDLQRRSMSAVELPLADDGNDVIAFAWAPDGSAILVSLGSGLQVL